MLKIKRPIPAERARLLIFDLDGTLVDSRIDLANSVNAMLRHFGRPELPCDVIATYIGDGAPMLVRRALGDPDDDAFVNDAIFFFMAWYREHKLDNTRVYPGIFTALDQLRAGGNSVVRQMAVLSNKPVNPSRQIVEALGLGKFFFQVYGGNSFHTKKPDPFGALQLAREAGVEPGETVVLGDSHNDILTALNAGMWSIGLTYGLSPQTLEISPPDVLVDTPEEIPLALEPQAAATGVHDTNAQNGDMPPSPS
jgi:phosphoglycolate phosphatase